MSSAILYIAIVAIWAFVLVPRWLRRSHLVGGENAAPEDLNGAVAVAAGGPSQAAPEADWGYEDPADWHSRTSYRNAPPLPRSRVLQARRRLLTMLVTLTGAAAACTALSLTPWWICVPPAGMLGMYLLLLREAALADAEQASWHAAEAEAETERAHRARQLARAERVEHSAQVIDISDRLGDQLYDQYADATMRAVGD